VKQVDTHGLRRTNAVTRLLEDAEWSANSDRWIAEKCGVDHVFVGKVRRQLVTVTSSPAPVRYDFAT